MFPKLIFTKLDKTEYPPTDKPLLTWDGNCGFCHYWMLRWKLFTGDKVEYRPFQESAKHFPDIEYKYFKQAVHLVDLDGKIYTGPAAVFQAFQYGDRYRWVMPLYRKLGLFRFLSDHFYSFVSRNRTVMYKITVRLWGKNPIRQKNYWAYYLGGLTVLIAVLLILV
jgi:predicted DCC family thiol-disulfide oxidoreductase YuxK